MTDWKLEFSRALEGKKIIEARRSDSHGKCLILELSNDVQLWAWSYNTELQVVVYDFGQKKILCDLRSQDCIIETERYKNYMINLHPNIYGSRGSDPFPDFKVIHKKLYLNRND